MRVLGIDPSSTFCGNATIDTPDSIIGVEVWERDKGRSHPQGFKDYYDWQILRIMKYHPQMAVVEMGSYSMGRGGKGNFQAVQAVSFYQSVACLACKNMGLVVIETRATSARKAALGNGGLAKDKVWEIMRKRYPELFAPKTRGGLDECDALVLALAGERVAER
jgi:Holliday junction resolvasome RuvABC endonuclease subunit